MKLIKVVKIDGHLVRDCPYNKRYEAINRYFTAKVGDEVCKFCPHNKGVRIDKEIPFVKCNHPDKI